MPPWPRPWPSSNRQQTVKIRQLVAELETYKQTLRAAADEYDLDRKRDSSYRTLAYRDLATVAGAVR